MSKPDTSVVSTDVTNAIDMRLSKSERDVTSEDENVIVVCVGGAFSVGGLRIVNNAVTCVKISPAWLVPLLNHCAGCGVKLPGTQWWGHPSLQQLRMGRWNCAYRCG